MKYVYGVGWWGKADMVTKTLEHIAENIDPLKAEILFIFDECGAEPLSVESSALFQVEAARLLTPLGFKWSGVDVQAEIMEMGCHNMIIDHMMATDAIAAICPQDDNQILSKTFLDDLDRLFTYHGDRVGYVGCRDGYGTRYSNFISSPWSNSDNARAKLPIGEFVERLLMNPGPLIYPRKLVEKIGKIDTAYSAWYWWDDYAMKSQQAGHVNLLLSADFTHFKWGRMPRSKVYQDFHGWVAKDLALLNARWGPHYGGNVI